jgi:hypothetical protein
MSGQDMDYDFEAKREYRDYIWKILRDTCGPGRREMNALLLPGLSGDEIMIAVREGFRRNRIVIVDKNPAVVASVHRKFPDIRKAYGVPVSRVGERLVQDKIVIHCANLDLCGPVSWPSLREITAFARSRCLANGSFVAVTALRGRERKHEFETYKHIGQQFHIPGFTHMDNGRLTAVFAALSGTLVRHVDRDDGMLLSDVYSMDHVDAWHYTPSYVGSGIYKSDAGHQTMMWMIFDMMKNERRDA